MPDAKKQGRSNKAMTFFVCFLAALAGLLFGLDIGVIAGALPFIADEFQITSHTQEFFPAFCWGWRWVWLLIPHHCTCQKLRRKKFAAV